MKNQQGFTLIELVVVIVILGILAAVAVPKFIDMQVDARKATINGMYGAVQSAASLARAQALVKDQTGAEGTIQMDGENIIMVYGYPEASSGGIALAVRSNGFHIVSVDGTTSFYLGTAPNHRQDCLVVYAQATATGPAAMKVGDSCQ